MQTILAAMAAVIFLYFNVVFIIAQIKKDNSIVDIGWGIGFILTAWVTLLSFGSFSARQAVLTALVTVWGVRLAAHIYMRNKGKEEDWRYQKMRDNWGRFYILGAYFKVFITQAVFMFLVSLPIIHGNATDGGSEFWWLLAGICLFALGFFFESAADYHLSQFIKDKKAGIKEGLLTSGVWRFSRHPNYFGEAAMWWGIWLISASTIKWELNPLQDCGWWTIIGPITITILVRFVSGVPMLEKKYEGDEEFEEYKKQTNIFVPMPVKKKLNK